MPSLGGERVLDYVGITGEEHTVSFWIYSNQFEVLNAVDLLDTGTIVRIKTERCTSFLQ